MRCITVDLDIAKRFNLSCALVYSVLQELTKTGVLIDGFQYVRTSASEIADIIDYISRPQVTRSLITLRENGVIGRLELGKLRNRYLYGVKKNEE
ncbi:hypothetical protein HMPREF0872_04060 [Veillonella montpellierensis DNF00314]|uniref:MarR family transcriptional regulator n=1 Tax=Veillonella montpellierensis DNF00314 TaxID=1401067 RepID=A0A096AL69_9FIRM|nr:hypothetical protein [Veillonella montpellierensis]KGF47575.1 hypothetical protein HMPREF0872_04060 [Veillonella montpellierensis DNF00314]